MGVVTRIRTVKLPQEKTFVYLDGKFAFILPTEVCRNLHLGQTLSDEEMSLYKNYSSYFACLSAAKQLLTLRLHSKTELRTKLSKKYPKEAVDLVIKNLSELGLLNDSDFAHVYVDNCNTCHPKGKSLIISELRRKGVSNDVIQDSLSELDEMGSAYRVASRKAEKLAPLGKKAFSQKLFAFLARKGFKYEVISQTIDRLWEENKNTESEEEYEYQQFD